MFDINQELVDIANITSKLEDALKGICGTVKVCGWKYDKRNNQVIIKLLDTKGGKK